MHIHTHTYIVLLKMCYILLFQSAYKDYYMYSKVYGVKSLTTQCVVDPETGEPQDELLPQAKQMIAELGSKCTTVSEIIHQKDETVYKAIQEGLERANQHSVSRAQKVSLSTIM